MAIQLHLKQRVGTTYKRALENIHLTRDWFVPLHSTLFTLIDPLTNWMAFDAQSERLPCVNLVTLIRN